MIAENGTAYDLIGPEGAPVITLIHGLGLCRKLWASHLGRLSQNYRVLNYDLYGHGESAPPPETASLTVYAKQLKELIDELGIDKVHLVGFSIGGMINRGFAIDYSDRLHSLAILNSPHERGDEAQVLVEERARKVIEEGPMATMDAALERWFTPSFRANHKDQTELVRQWRQDADAKSYPDACMVLAAGVKELIRPAIKINCPSLVMTCENDSGSTPAMSHAIADEIAGAETIIIPELQHLGLMENPEAYTQPILDFIGRTEQNG